VSYNYPEVGIIDTWRIRELLTPHPGIVWLVETIESTPMSNYREAYLWLLAAQIPVAIYNCTAHANITTLLLGALGEGYGRGEERVWVLDNITQHSLTVNITSALLMWPSPTNETIVNATIIYVEIPDYLELW